MIEVVSIGGVAVLLIANFWVTGRFRRWGRHREDLLRELSELRNHSRLLHENSSQAIIKLQTSGLIRSVNSAAERLFGYSADELLGQSILKVLPGGNLASRTSLTIEIARKDGSSLRLPFKAVGARSDRYSYIYLFFGQMPEEEVESQEGAADRALAFMAATVGRIAGQYETLLTTINGYSELALMETPENSPSREKLEEILNASERASDLTRHLVAFSGKQFVPVEPVELDRLVKGMVSQLNRVLPNPIDFDLHPTDGDLRANGDFVRQVLLLLCGSAGGRMDSTDRLQIRTRQCELREETRVQSGMLKPGVYGVLTVSDSGRPLSAQSKQHLFEPLYSIHEDMGVDLSSVYGILQSLGGGIDVEDGEDGGTKFDVLLPCVAAADMRVPEDLASKGQRQ